MKKIPLARMPKFSVPMLGITGTYEEACHLVEKENGNIVFKKGRDYVASRVDKSLLPS